VKVEPKQKWCSFDGDADRLVYFYTIDGGSVFTLNKYSKMCVFSEGGPIHLLDGDKIAVLFALFVDYLLAETKLASSMSFGIVQTAYANGNATRFIRKHFPVTLTGIERTACL